MFKNVHSIWGALGVMLALVALYLVLEYAGGASKVIGAFTKGGVDIFTTLQARNATTSNGGATAASPAGQ